MRKRSFPAVVLLILFTAAVAYGKPAPGRDIPAAQREMIIREAYGNLMRFAVVSGDPLKFSITNLRTLDASEFDRALWVDLVTMPGGDMLDMARKVTTYEGRGEIVVYQPKWNLEGADYLLTNEGVRLQSMTVAEVLAETAREIPEARTIHAITSYEVSVFYKERSRSYKAAVLWLPARPGRAATLFFADNITQGLEEAVRERPNPTPNVRATQRAGSFKSLYTCEPSTDTKFYDRLIQDSTGHSTGKHGSRLIVDTTCSCNSACTSTCQPNILLGDCFETGNTYGICHKMATNINSIVRDRGDAIMAGEGAKCAAGLGCVKKTCNPLCICDLSVDVGFEGANLKFTSSGDPDWTGNQGVETECGACNQLPDPPPTGGGGGEGPRDKDPADGGSGGGAGGGCELWGWTCTYTPVPGGEVADCTPICLS